MASRGPVLLRVVTFSADGYVYVLLYNTLMAACVNLARILQNRHRKRRGKHGGCEEADRT